MAKPDPTTPTVLQPHSNFDLSAHTLSPIKSLALFTSDHQTLIFIGTHSGSLIALSQNHDVSSNSKQVSFLRSVSVSDSPVDSIIVVSEIDKVVVLCDGLLFIVDLMLSLVKRLNFAKGVCGICRRVVDNESEFTNLRDFVGGLENPSAKQRFLQKLGGGIRANGVKTKEGIAPPSEGSNFNVVLLFAIVIGKRLLLVELVNGLSLGILKEIQCIDGVKTVVWLNDSIIVGTVSGYSLFSCVTGQSGVIFTLPDVSSLPLLKLLWKEKKVLLLVDNVGVVVNEHGQPVSGSLVFRWRPDSVGELGSYLVVVKDGKMELYHKRSGACIQTVIFGAEGVGPCVVATTDTQNGQIVAMATPSKVICYQKVPSEEQIKDLLRKKNFKEAISLVEELEGEGEMSSEMLSFVHAQVGFLLLFDLHFEEAVNHFLKSETMQPSELFPFILRDPNRWSLLVPRNRYWGLHPPPAPLEDVVDHGLMAIQRAIFLRKAGVDTAVDEWFLSNPPIRAELLALAIKNISRYLEVSREKDLDVSVREGVDTLLMYLYRALNRVDDMERLASSENSCIVTQES